MLIFFGKRGVKIKKNDIQKRMKENQEKNAFTVKKFEESVENVKIQFFSLTIQIFSLNKKKAQENRDP